MPGIPLSPRRVLLALVGSRPLLEEVGSRPLVVFIDNWPTSATFDVAYDGDDVVFNDDDVVATVFV